MEANNREEIEAHLCQNDQWFHLLFASLGASGEADELAKIAKDYIYYHKEFDRAKFIKTLEELLWHIALAARAVDMTFEELVEKSIVKLCAIKIKEKLETTIETETETETEIEKTEEENVSIPPPPVLSDDSISGEESKILILIAAILKINKVTEQVEKVWRSQQRPQIYRIKVQDHENDFYIVNTRTRIIEQHITTDKIVNLFLYRLFWSVTGPDDVTL